MMDSDRYTVRRVVNNLIDALIDQGVDKIDILNIVEHWDLTNSDMEYFDIKWLEKDD